MDPRDIEIRRRLDKLKEPIPQVQSEEELRQRLNNLKGLSSSSALSNKYIFIPKPKSDTEQIDDLMKQYSVELSLGTPSASSSADAEIEERLNSLKSEQIPSSPLGPAESLPRNETKSFVKKILAEAMLEGKTEKSFPEFSKQPPVNSDEKMDCTSQDPYYDDMCYICEKRPVWVCRSCDGNVFCNGCFKEYHIEIDEHHERKPVKRVKNVYSDSDSD